MEIEEIAKFLTSGVVGFIPVASMIITQVLKDSIIPTPSRIIPLISFLIGFGLMFLCFTPSLNLILPAILVGGASAGIYDLGKKTILGK